MLIKLLDSLIQFDAWYLHLQFTGHAVDHAERFRVFLPSGRRPGSVAGLDYAFQGIIGKFLQFNFKFHLRIQ